MMLSPGSRKIAAVSSLRSLMWPSAWCRRGWGLGQFWRCGAGVGLGGFGWVAGGPA
jgi:hypothetical protein